MFSIRKAIPGPELILLIPALRVKEKIIDTLVLVRIADGYGKQFSGSYTLYPG